MEGASSRAWSFLGGFGIGWAPDTPDDIFELLITEDRAWAQ